MFDRTANVLLVTLFTALCLACGGGGSTTRPTGTERAAPEEPAPVAPPELQTKREVEIQRLVNRGIFRSVEGNTATVTPAFHALDYADKQLACALVAAYHYKVPDGTGLKVMQYVTLVDVKTGKVVGTFDRGGLTLD